MGRADIPLKAITTWLAIVYIAWFACAIAISSLSDQNRGFPAGAPGGDLQQVYGPLAYITQNHFYHYGTEGVITFFTVLACWLAAYNQTRQLRSLALVATTWAVFAWLTYMKFTLAALDPSFTCGSPAVGPLPSSSTSRWCDVSLAAAIMAVLLEFGKVLLWGWAAFRFLQMRHLEPYCELDKSEIEYEQRKQAGLVSENQANLPPVATTATTTGTTLPGHEPTSIHVQSAPVGLMEADAPLQTAVGVPKITSLDQQRLSISSRLVLFFIGFSLVSWMITTLPFIQLFRFDYQDDASATATAIGDYGDKNLLFNIYFPALHLLFALSFGAMAAYDRLRDNTVSPIFLNILSAMMCWGIMIYSLRRISVDPNDGTNSPAWRSQMTMAIGWALLTCSETLRIPVMAWNYLTKSPAMYPHKPAVGCHIGRLLYWITQGIMFTAAVAWLIALIVLQADGGLFNYGAEFTTSPVTLPSVQASLQYAYHNYCISLMIMVIHFAGNMYINLAGTRSAVLSSYMGQLFTVGGWWLLCWAPTYAQIHAGGALYDAFCTPAAPNLVCNLTQAMGILGLIMFAGFVFNTLISLWRLILVDLAAKSALPTAELARQGTTVTRQEALSRGTVGFGDTWISAEGFLWLSMAGWLIFTFAQTDYGRNGFMVVGGPNFTGFGDTLGFEIFTFLVSHFLVVAGLFNMFVQSHIVTNKTYRDHSHAWRYVQFAGYLFLFSFAIPLLILDARYAKLFTLADTHKATLAGLAIFVFGQLCGLLQMAIYSIIYPAQPVTVMLPTTQMAYDKAGNPVLGAVPVDVEKGETLNPHHDQAGLGTNYAKTDWRHQTALGSLGGAREKDSQNRDLETRHETTDTTGSAGGMERNTAITGTQQPTLTPGNTTADTI